MGRDRLALSEYNYFFFSFLREDLELQAELQETKCTSKCFSYMHDYTSLSIVHIFLII